MNGSLSRSRRHELTAALNGYRTELSDNYSINKSSSLRSIYHDKISSKAPETTRHHQKIMKDRLSFYDNYDDDQNLNDYKFR